MKSKPYSQVVQFDIDNAGTSVVVYYSNSPITLERVVEMVENTEGPVNWDEYSVTLLGSVEELASMDFDSEESKGIEMAKDEENEDNE